MDHASQTHGPRLIGDVMIGVCMIGIGVGYWLNSDWTILFIGSLEASLLYKPILNKVDVVLIWSL